MNYGKNVLEGEYGEDEIGYIECDKVIPLGGKKPKPIQGRKVEEQPAKKEVVETKVPAKRGRPPKVKKEETSSETIPVVGTPGTFEYLVTEIKGEDIEDIQLELNTKGEQGWELCGFDTNKPLFRDIQMIVIFKRRRG